MLKFVNTNKKFVGGEVVTTALSRISLEIKSGEYIAITGPSGCGKSTLLSILGMLDSPDDGEYWFDGQNVAGWSEVKLNELRRGRIGFIFQSFNLIEELTVEENVGLALEYSNVPARQRRERVSQLLDKLGVAHRAKHRPSQLSGGQQQRVAIARALVTKPAVLLADEPTGNLDSVHGEEVMRILEQINGEGTTIVMVTHSPSHAARAARIVRLLDGALVAEPVPAVAA
ncbi:ABC transporter ATP-binding protein [Janthinobacterium sp. BJB401]|uniref:ABC transporter ATP-binding protein n=1 Tax=Janthinobacterium sp. BJB401 TaxID=2745934 RepID=UPI001595283F|nr:ABC transporter ATP-binding protein [Janthinobacterium sp. BJB401]NVI82982.1 ABC transporter ATP-binding protein [Janthinobacterium sp. BJB401]